MGSSPPARGPPARAVGGGVCARLIPACAGTTFSLCACYGAWPAHPRLRGDHFLAVCVLWCLAGSSPPARGPLSWLMGRSARLRLIPACAGTTRSHTGECRREWAHPRLRGDHLNIVAVPFYVCGSSPPARGPPGMPVSVLLSRGLIPACAGTTSTFFPGSPRGPAHPRLRGDHRNKLKPVEFDGGSSPPARGPQAASPSGEWVAGLIPACAGTTVCRARPYPVCRAHPRLRGDHCPPVRDE